MEGSLQDLRLVLHDRLPDCYELSRVLLAVADRDGTLQLLTSGWERSLGYGRAELKTKTLRQLMGAEGAAGAAAAAVLAILDRRTAGSVDVLLHDRTGLAKRFRLHRHFDQEEKRMYIVAEECADALPGSRVPPLLDPA